MFKQLSYHKYYFSKWLLALSILFSGLTFLGNNDNLPPKTEDANQTEQLYSGNDGLKRTTTFYNAFAFSLTQKTLSKCIKEHKHGLLLSNKVYKRLHKINLMQILSFDNAKRFIQLINYSQSSSEGEHAPIQFG